MGLFFSRKKQEPERPQITEQDKAVLVSSVYFISLFIIKRPVFVLKTEKPKNKNGD